MDTMKLCQDILDDFERDLRSFVQERLEAIAGARWWKQRVPEQIRKNAQETQKRQGSRVYPRLPEADPIHYTYITELADIMLRKDNYQQVFGEFFGPDASGIQTKLKDITQIRDAARHVRPVLGEPEYQRLVVTVRDIYSAIQVPLPTSVSPMNQPEEPDDDQVLLNDGLELATRSRHNLPRPDYDNFYGRQVEREAILKHLTHPRAWVVCIDGIGGVGKTSLALHTAYSLVDPEGGVAPPFEYVIWGTAKTQSLSTRGVVTTNPTFLDLGTLVTIILDVTGFSDISQRDPDETLRLVHEILSCTPCLLVLDNLETVKDPALYSFLADLPQPSKALVTSRERVEGSQRNLRLTALSDDEGLSLLRELAGHLQAEELLRAADADLLHLLRRMGNIPLAIKLAAGKVAGGTSLGSYLARLDSGEAQEDVLKFCFDRIWEDLSPDSQLLLMAVSLFDAPCSEEELRRVSALPQLRLEEALGPLRRASLVNSEYDSVRQTSLYSLLPLTSDFASQRMDENITVRNKLSDSLGAYLAERGDYEAAALHLRPLLVEGAIPEKVRLSNMLVDAAYRAYQNGSYPDSIGRLEQANSYSETGFLFHTWGVIERDEGSFSVARDRFRKAVQLEQGRLATWRSWGTMEQRLENFERAIECFERAVELPGADAQDHHRLGVCYSRHGTTLDNTADRRGFFEKAAVHLKAGFYGNPVGYRERHHNVVNSHALALTLQRVGDRDGAISACRVGLALEPGNIRLRRLVDSL